MRRLWTRALWVGAIGLATGITSGCVEEREPINQVQPNALAKSFFVGMDLQGSQDDPEFYFQTTLIDVGYGANQDGLFSSTYAQPMSRIKWQVTEDLLIARITYERINDSDGKGAGPTSNDGVIAAIYPILSHFDIQRAYNPSTGEELNVLVENMTDQPWNHREFFRVDWSQNLATDAYDFDTLSLVGVYGSIKYEPVAYYINDPRDPDAPHFETDEGYFDVTNKAFATPGLIDLSHFGWGIDSFPACFLDADFAGGSAPTGNCNPVELTLRQSYRRVGVIERDAEGEPVKDPDSNQPIFHPSDFEPKHWDGFRFQAYGAFYEDRHGYARSYGMVDEKWHRLIDRYDVWERNHYYSDPIAMTGEVKCFVPTSACADGSCVGTPYGEDPNRDANGDGTADECERVGQGSYCDSLSQKCTLPYRQRTPKPVVWYYTEQSSPAYFDMTARAANEWDAAMRGALSSAKYAECMRFSGGDIAGCSAQFPVLRSQQDSNWDLVNLTKEVDDCRHKKPGANGQPVYGGSNCEAVADKLGAERGYEPEVIALAKQPEMVVFCHSPVEENDPALCAPAGKRLPAGMTKADCDAVDGLSADQIEEGSPEAQTKEACSNALRVRIGDLRYNQVNSFAAPQTPSPWGIMVDSEDPLTGEKIASSINVWTHVNDLFAQGIVDISRYIKGELKTEDVTEGTYVKDWAAASEAAGYGGMAGRFTKEDVRKRIAAVAGREYDPEIDEAVSAAILQNNPALKAKVKEAVELVKTVRSEVSAPSLNAPVYAQRLRALAGTDIEAELMTKAILEYSGADGMPMSDGVLNIASPVRGANRTLRRQFERFKQEALGQRGACILSAEDAMAAAPLAIADLANVLEEKFGAFNAADPSDVQKARADKMREYIAQRAHYAVIVHEMGHSIALRHNFVSSSDAFNYRSQYWQLRTKNGTVNTVCNTLSPDGEGCIGPRYFDPVTPNEKKNLIWMFMHSSVMDYAGEITQDFLGLGAYDFAAARMFYGDTVAVYQDPTYAVKTKRGRGLIEKMDNFGGLLGFDPQVGNATGQNPVSINGGYAAINKEYQSIINCVDIPDPTIFKPSDWDDAKDGAWHPVLDGLIVSADGNTYSRCRQQPVDMVRWTDLRFPTQGGTGAEAGDFYRGGPSVDPGGRIRVPYGFATDRWADLGNVSVYRHDNGADTYELFDFFITQQEVGHIFDAYRRGRETFSVRGAANRTLGRYNEKMRDGAKGLGLLVNIFKDLGIEAGLWQDDIVDYALAQFYPQNTLSSGIAMDHFSRMMARPEPGDHIAIQGDTTLDGVQVLRPRSIYFTGAAGDADAEVIIPNGATGYYGNISSGGKLLENTLAEGYGEYDAEYTWNAGSYYDKMNTTMLLTESEDNFISDSVQDFHDARYRSVSMADVFREGYRRWIANNLTGDDAIKAVRLAANSAGNPLTGPDGYPTMPLGTTSWWPTAGPEVCFPNANSIVCSQYGATSSAPFDPQAVANTALIDPLVGWEQQKFLITWTYVYLPENQKRYWLDRLEMKELGISADPKWQGRIELHLPGGSTYVARRYGTEVIFGKTVEKGIAARVLQYANELMSRAYQGLWYDENGEVLDQANPPPGSWFIADINSATGEPIVMWDPNMIALGPTGNGLPNGKPGCSSTPGDNLECTCSANKSCLVLDKYKSVPWFMARMDTWIHVGAKGLYPEAL